LKGQKNSKKEKTLKKDLQFSTKNVIKVCLKGKKNSKLKKDLQFSTKNIIKVCLEGKKNSKEKNKKTARGKFLKPGPSPNFIFFLRKMVYLIIVISHLK
jgi:hypothetical protein